MDYDSESEKQPRTVVDLLGNFTMLNYSTVTPFKLRDFNPQVGTWIPFPGVRTPTATTQGSTQA
jgi:hypothetical protein